MLKIERHRALLDFLARDGRIDSGESATRLAVSKDSIRRDLRELAARGALQKVHGGAVPAPPVPAAYAARLETAHSVKAAIAAAAASLIGDGQTVFMDGGTTALAVAQHLPAALRATIVTHAPPIANALIDHPRVDVYLAGGRIDKRLAVATSSETVDYLRGFRADLCLLGVCAVHPEIGLTLPTSDERAIKRVMVEQAARVVAMADADKIDTGLPCVLAPIDRVDELITDARLSHAQHTAYQPVHIVMVDSTAT